MQKKSQDIKTISATVDDPETAWKNGAENSSDPNSPCVHISQVEIKILFLALPIAQIVVGAVYHNDCPEQRMIPIFLEVLGTFTLPLAVNVLFPKLIREPVRSPLISINFFPLLSWFTAGNIWTFKTLLSNTPYCSHTLLWSAVAFIIMDYIFLFLMIVYLICWHR